MKFCPLVPEICRGQVHVPRKERKKERKKEEEINNNNNNNNKKKRSKNNKSAILHFPNFRDVCHFQNGCQNTALKMGGKNSTLSDIINILYVGR
jgi:negative regulator of genetic competence, sporulation and motility